MPIDARLLLAGVVPDPTDSAAKAFSLSQSIRNAPILRQLQAQKITQGQQGIAQGEQVAQLNEQKLGNASAQAIHSVLGDATAEQVTPEIFAQSTRALADLGVPLDDDDLTFSPENVGHLLKMSQAGKKMQMQKAGLTRRVQSSNNLGGGAVQLIYNDGSMEIVSASEADKILIKEARDSEVSFIGDKAKAGASGTVLGKVGAESETAKIAADTISTIKTSEEQAKVDVSTGSAEKVGAAQAIIAELRETAVLEARDLNTLKKTSGARRRNIIKAEGFRDALKSGLRTSGVGRQAALFAPIGVWTDQGSFDEIFNAFAEVAAREQLKASGEVRPTDADVQGMKGAMFGVGRSEEANLQLLNEFIEEQKSLELKLNSSGSDTKPQAGQAPSDEQGSVDLSGDELSELEALRAEMNQ